MTGTPAELRLNVIEDSVDLRLDELRDEFRMTGMALMNVVSEVTSSVFRCPTITATCGPGNLTNLRMMRVPVEMQSR